VEAEEIALLKDEPKLEEKPEMSPAFQLSPWYQDGDCAAACVANTVANRSAQFCSTPSASAAGRFFSYSAGVSGGSSTSRRSLPSARSR